MGNEPAKAKITSVSYDVEMVVKVYSIPDNVVNVELWLSKGAKILSISEPTIHFLFATYNNFRYTSLCSLVVMFNNLEPEKEKRRFLIKGNNQVIKDHEKKQYIGTVKDENEYKHIFEVL